LYVYVSMQEIVTFPAEEYVLNVLIATVFTSSATVYFKRKS
jgi:hypothetical protein